MSERKVTILLVDDNKSFVTRMISLLKEVDNISTVHIAFNSDEASRLLAKKPDLVLLDIQMPGSNGINLLKLIKDSKESEVIMLTNHVGEYYRKECKELGALYFLDKTNDFELLPDMIKDFAIGE